jgi:3-oxoacyl-[acyl-carrier-protein] synthase-3
MIFSKIIGTGGYLPKEVLTNYDLEKKVETSHQWIVERTGIFQRHIVSAEETVAHMGAEAAKKAMEAAGVGPLDIGLIIVATCTPDLVFPATACLIQAELGVPPGPAFDIQAVCSGFIYALSVADQFIRAGTVKRALVIGSEAMSKVLDWTDRSTCVLFGDGAGAVVIEASPEPGILSCNISADGRYKDILYLDNQPGKTLKMQGNVVFKLAVTMLGEVATNSMAEAGITVADIDWLVPHQANIRIIEATADKLKIPMEKVVVTLKNHGNTSAASIPLAFDTAVRDGRIVAGQQILLEAIGGGLTWGTVLLRV